MNLTIRITSLGVVLAAFVACAGNVSLGGSTGASTKKACTKAAGCSGPAPTSPNFACADGVTTGGPACLEENGVCSWSIVECPALDGGAAPDAASSADAATEDPECTLPAGCTDPMPNMPNTLCPDGVKSSGPSCRQHDGKCSWQILQCPAVNACDKYNLPKCDSCDLLPTQSCVVGTTCVLASGVLTCPAGTWTPQPADFKFPDCHRFCK